MHDTALAPCVAVIGPANSGKTTLLHLLDIALQDHQAGALVYIIKGQPDGSGRYLYLAASEREKFKPRTKGQWIPLTVDTIVDWIRNARRTLELTLLDFGGKHDAVNGRMLRECSHYIVMAGSHLPEGEVHLWVDEAERNGLIPVAHVVSLWEQGDPFVEPGSLR